MYSCDWCEDETEAYWYKEVHKKKKTGLVSTGLRWYSCRQHLAQLEHMLPKSEHNLVHKLGEK